MAGNVEQLPSLHHVAVPAQPEDALEVLLASVIPRARRAAIARQRELRDRLGRGLASALIAAAAAAMGQPFEPEMVEYPPDGPPRWIGGPACSLSHTGHAVVVLIASGGPIGVDLESRSAATLEDVRLILPDGLRESVNAGRIPPTDAWTRMEAALKADGRGLKGVSDLRFESEQVAVTSTGRWVLQPVEVPAGDHCWCALPAHQAAPVRLHTHSIEDLVRLLQTAQPRRIPAP